MKLLKFNPLRDIRLLTVHRQYNGQKEHTMSPMKRYAKKQAKARQRRRHKRIHALSAIGARHSGQRRPCTKP